MSKLNLDEVLFMCLGTADSTDSLADIRRDLVVLVEGFDFSMDRVATEFALEGLAADGGASEGEDVSISPGAEPGGTSSTSAGCLGRGLSSDNRFLSFASFGRA